jgi:hypothetical protein
MLITPNYSGKIYELFLILTMLSILIAGWIQHVLACIAASRWLLLILGLLLPPAGIFHGFGIWLGFWR